MNHPIFGGNPPLPASGGSPPAQMRQMKVEIAPEVQQEIARCQRNNEVAKICMVTKGTILPKLCGEPGVVALFGVGGISIFCKDCYDHKQHRLHQKLWLDEEARIQAEKPDILTEKPDVQAEKPDGRFIDHPQE